MEIKLDIRDKFLRKIRSTIIGPLDKDEVLKVSPKTKYLYGYISPAPKSDDDVPSLRIKLAEPLGIQPGLLSTTCSPGYNTIVVLANLSLSNPF